MVSQNSRSKKIQHAHTSGRLGLDKRAHKLAVEVGDGDELLNTSALAELLGVSTQWCEIARGGDYGPPFVIVGNHLVRYRRTDVRAWLEQRVVRSTAEYTNSADGRTKLGRRERAEA